MLGLNRPLEEQYIFLGFSPYIRLVYVTYVVDILIMLIHVFYFIVWPGAHPGDVFLKVYFDVSS